MSLSSSLDLYSILGLTYEATAEEIKTAYRQAARRFHPDVNSNLGAGVHFRDVAAAYEILNDERAHKKYRAERKAFGKLPDFNGEVTVSKRTLAIIKEPQVLYLLVDIYAKKLKDEHDVVSRTPLNIGLVLDRSSSMAGQRLEKVKVAAHQIIEQLAPSDRITIVTFADRADVVVPNTEISMARDIKQMVNLMAAGGGTEMFQGLDAAYRQVESKFDDNFVNHIILVTDGRTFGDDEACLALAAEAGKRGIGISAMGIGDEWNDVFLDQIAGQTGGAADYISSPSQVVSFLNQRVQNLGQAFGERMQATIAPDPDIILESAFRLSPTAQPLLIETHPIQLGSLTNKRPTSFLLQFQMAANMTEGNRSLARIDVSGDVMHEGRRVPAKYVTDVMIDIAESPQAEIPPNNIVDALSKMTLYRMQERTEQSLVDGNVADATKRLENLATRLLELGQGELAQEAMAEARRVASTHMFSEGGRKNLKFGTRALMTQALTD